MENITGHTTHAVRWGHTVISNEGRDGREDCSGSKGKQRDKLRRSSKETGGNDSKYKKEQNKNNEAHGT